MPSGWSEDRVSPSVTSMEMSVSPRSLVESLYFVVHMVSCLSRFPGISSSAANAWNDSPFHYGLKIMKRGWLS